MGSPAELTLGRPSNSVKVPLIKEQLERLRRLEQHLKALEDERRKVEAFKRELPLCMQLLRDAIEDSKKQLVDSQQPPLKRRVVVSCNFEDDSTVKNSNERPVVEGFVPLPNQADDSTLEDVADQERGDRTCERYKSGGKSNELPNKFWSQEEAFAHGQEIVSLMSTDKPYKKRDFLRVGQDEGGNEVTKPILESQRKAGGAFLPFSRERQPPARTVSAELLELSPSSGDGELSPRGSSGIDASVEVANHQGNQMPNAAVPASSGQASSPSHRKPRRCWSSELHRRFVHALQQLGGSEVATPKQIRELMKVDGLTNDEVKSHLQKYRLHTRRPNPSVASHAPQLVVLGGIWVPQEYAAHGAVAVQQGPLYNSAQQAPNLHQTSPSQDQYAQLQLHPSLYYDDQQVAAAAQSQLQLHPPFHYTGQQAVATHSQGSSQGPLRLAGHSSEAGRDESTGEDGNEGSSWRGGYQDERFQEEENGNSYREENLHAHNWRYGRESGEDDSEAENGRVYEITV